MYRHDFHPHRHFRCHLAKALALSIGWVGGAAAQEADDSTSSDVLLSVTSPELTKFFEASYPEEALKNRVEGTVILELTISSLGAVESVRVIDGPGQGLNEAARDAAFRFVFAPARAGGEPRAARIHYAYEFHLPSVEESNVSALSPEGASPADLQSMRPTESIDSTRNERSPSDNEPLESTEGSAEGEPIVVRGYRDQDRTRRSAHAVTVVDLERVQRESADVGEVLARVEGVNVQRVGGLGSRARVSLGGFDDTQVRFFIDGVPLEYAGYSFGIENVPVTFAEHINIYKGVVPVRLGADSLGGAFDLITDRKTLGTHAMVSLQAGSFDTYRMAASARHLHEKTGFFVKGEAFLDETRNDYLIDVKVSDLTGERRDAQVRRFHDGYEAFGGNVELGFVNRKWARRLLTRAFITDYTKEIQHNLLMTVPYGEAQYGGRSTGGSLRYEQDFGQGLSGTFVSGYVFDRTDVLDAASCVYDWYRQCIVERRNPGEIGALPSDRSLWDHTGYLRWNLEWKLRPDHEIRLATAPTYFTRTGEERHAQTRNGLDRLGAQREMLKWVSGAEYQAELFGSRLQNIVFGKGYLQASQGEDVLTSSYTARYSVQKLYWGAGDALRYQFWDWAFGKISYEYAIRLPEPEELFGKGALVQENLDLLPERSHNANLTFLINNLETALGKLDGSVTGFYREADQLIVLLGRDNVFYYDNVFRGRIVGVEGALTWISPREYVELGGNTTYQDFRNVSDEGTFGQFNGDRIPNKPYLFANGRLRLQARQFAGSRDELSLTWHSRYVHEFFKSWESVGSGQLQTKPTIDSQLVHTLVLAYLARDEEDREVSFSAEVQNLSDEKTYDFYGQQRPGRSVFAKAMVVF